MTTTPHAPSNDAPPPSTAAADDASPEIVNVAAWLPYQAERLPDAMAVAVGDRHGGFTTLTFAQLNAMCDKAAHALKGLGICDGARAVLMVTPGPAFFALTFALFKTGAVPVMVDPGMGVRNLAQCLEEADPHAFIGVTKAHVARALLRWAPSADTLITVGPRLGWGGHTFSALMDAAPDRPFPMAPTEPDQRAAILFTSGSTGVPKGAVYTHGVFAAQVRMLGALYGIEPGERDLSTFPLFALFGPALGMASVVPDMDASRPSTADPAKLVHAIQTWGCTNVFANPVLVDKLGKHCHDHGITLDSVRRVLSAGAPARGDAVALLQQALNPGVEIFTPYGATESLPVASVGSDTLLGETLALTEQGKGVCVGAPAEGMNVAIIPITDDPIATWDDGLSLPQGELGEIVVDGPVVTQSYFNRPQKTRRAKIFDPATKRYRHRMGDLGYFDDQGRLWMCGRKAHRVEVDGELLLTVPCEAVFNTHPQVARTALVKAYRGVEPVAVLCVELAADAQDADTSLLTPVLLQRAQEYDHTRAIRTILFHPGFPVDVRHNAKIFREKLADWATEQLN